MNQQTYGAYGPYGAPQPYGVYGPYGAQPSVDNRGGSFQPISGISGNANTFNSNPSITWLNKNNQYNTGSGNTNKQQNIENQSWAIDNSGTANNFGDFNNAGIGNRQQAVGSQTGERNSIKFG